jgi:SEC-C motif-containing protein
MQKPSPNLPCPCCSGLKYKKCCQKYHKGAKPANAEYLMRSRYSAYAFGLADYIIKTTHPDNSDYTEEQQAWREDILLFCKGTLFSGLRVIDFTEEAHEAYVEFEASLSSGLLWERSRFLKENDTWLYVDGIFNKMPDND